MTSSAPKKLKRTVQKRFRANYYITNIRENIAHAWHVCQDCLVHPHQRGWTRGDQKSDSTVQKADLTTGIGGFYHSSL